MKPSQKSAKEKKKKRKLPTYLKDMEKVVALGLILGYLDVGVIGVSEGEFSFTLRGPNFWRLTSGLKPYLHSPGTGLAAQAYLRIEALIAYLLFVEEAYIGASSATASSTVWTIKSKWFRFAQVQSLLNDDNHSFQYRTAVLMLLNFGIGLGLVLKKLPFVITAIGFDKELDLHFHTSAAPLQKQRRRLPSLYTLPQGSAKLYWIGVIIGILLIVQQARIKSFAVGRGGEAGFGIRADTFQYKVLPGILQRLVEVANNYDDENKNES